MLAAYLTANNILQLPFKEQLEAQLQRRAICMYDIVTAKQTVKLAKVRACAWVGRVCACVCIERVLERGLGWSWGSFVSGG